MGACIDMAGSDRFSNASPFVQGYVEALFFTNEGEPDDALHELTVDDLAPETWAGIDADCAAFQLKAHSLIAQRIGIAELETEGGDPYTAIQAGRDFWFTRCGHGVGFWDRRLPHGLGDALTSLADEFGNLDIYTGDDGRAYLA